MTGPTPADPPALPILPGLPGEEDLRRELEALPTALRAELEGRGFDPERLVTLARPIFARRGAGPDAGGTEERNRIGGVVEPPREGDVAEAPRTGTAEHRRLEERGMQALRAGEVALCVLAGGMATRMG
ncbi:MAG: hypothetical protein ACRENE_32780, partial [Polyangiaceae bacterium]